MIRTLRSLGLGFLAAALAVVTVHQGLLLLSNLVGLEDRPPWSLAPVPPLGVPSLVNGMFWGGLWGVVMSALFERLPGGMPWLKGLLFGWLIFLFGNCLVRALVKGEPLFYGLEPAKLASVLLILSGFGVATALLYAWMRVRV